MNKKDMIEKLAKIKGLIDEEKQKKAQTEGKLSSLMERLKNEFGFDDVGSAETAFKKMEKEEATLLKSVEDGIKELEEAIS